MKKFKLNLQHVPASLLRKIDDKTFLVLEIPSLTGRKRYWMQDEEEIEAVDQVMEMALQSYECPKLPITRKTKDEKKSSNMFYDVATVRGKKPFEEVVK